MEENSYFIIDGCTERYEEVVYSLEDIQNVLIERGIQDFLANLCGKNPAIDKVVGEDFDEGDILLIKDYIDKEYSDKKVRVYDIDDREIESYPLNDLYNALIDWYIDAENGEIEICSLWCSQLQNFIDKGKWHIALRAEDGTIIKAPHDWPLPIKTEEGKTVWMKDGIEYHPLMWYGLSNEPILSDWIMRKDGKNGMIAIIPTEDGMGNYGSQMRIRGFEINYDLLYGGMTSWYFGACGNEGADFSKVIETCPMDFEEMYSGKGDLISDYCESIKLQSL